MKCKHGPCKCKANAAQNDGYCSESCRQQKSKDARCTCGHPDCR